MPQFASKRWRARAGLSCSVTPSDGRTIRLDRPRRHAWASVPADMSRYTEMFNRHNEITRTVEEIPGGVRTTTESNAPDLVAQLQAHVSSMYSRLDQGAEVMCMSNSLPTLFRHANGYHRQLTLTPTGVIAEETADDPQPSRKPFARMPGRSPALCTMECRR